MPAPTHELDDDDNLEMPPTKSAKVNHASEASLGDLFRVQISLSPARQPVRVWQGEGGRESPVIINQVTETDDAFGNFPWLEPINGLVLAKEACDAKLWSPNSGSCLSKLIRRDMIQSQFYQKIEEPTVDMAMMGLELFDKNGRLIPDFRKGGSRQGSGIWNREVDTGDILLIDEFHIKDSHNGFMLGDILFNAILEKARTKSPKFVVIAAPTAFARERTEGSLDEAKHACHRLAAPDDYDPPAPRIPFCPPGINELFRMMDNSGDAACAAKLRRLSVRHHPSEECWYATNDSGDTLLHVASYKEKRLCVQWLMANRPFLVHVRNDKGEVPIKSIELLNSKKTVQVTILERASALVAAGNGIQVACNACHVLRSLGLLDQLIAKSKGTAPGSLSLDYENGQILLTKDFARYEEIYGAPWLFVHRADYIDVLVDEAKRLGVQTRLGCEVKELNIGAPWVRLASDEIVTADVIIGCDGINSSIRTTLYPDIRPHPTNGVAYRAFITRSQLSSSLFETITASSECRFWIGPQAHLVLYPIHGGETFNLVLVITDARLNRRCENGNILELVREHMAGWNSVVKGLLQAIHELTRFPLYSVEDLPSFTSGLVALIGDAAHPTVPYLGQGAAVAVEDALVLGTLLGNLTRYSSSLGSESLRSRIPTILQTYDAIQHPRTTTIVAESRHQGYFNHLARGPEQRARDVEFAAYDTEATVSDCPWIDSTFNRELLGRDTEAVAVREFRRLVAEGLFNRWEIGDGDLVPQQVNITIKRKKKIVAREFQAV
ncbi:hypothetical protein G7Z17_g6715 [Cylindrodendrum hubeiense]|uniref:FAD-binding domain-containing protein n=1 Tax=Cylindrodendrum hubeiense TaxID=595255 RepID=A0A9P5HAF4_9HYPO|nr:hypothetical protein G7Z17_g6715 [Cylindrodendrum hubeiense]